MYVPAAFRAPDRQSMLDLMRENPFATLITCWEGAPAISHLPLYWIREGGRDCLIGHMAKANPHAVRLGARGTAVFHGPHAYVSARWAGPDAVPTWNYLAVHATGAWIPAQPGDLEAILDRMLREHEADPAAFRAGLSPGRFAALSAHIVALRLEIEDLEGAWKLSQNKPAMVQEEIAGHLSRGDADARAVAAAMRARPPAPGDGT